MIEYNTSEATVDSTKKIEKEDKKSIPYRYKKISRMGRVSLGIINEISVPLDTINRFINLTLQTMEENEQGREFLLESKAAIRKTAILLKRLNNYGKKIEKEIREISTNGRED